MLRKFKVELELCGPSYCTIDDVIAFVGAIKENKNLADDADVFALGDFDITDEGPMTIDEWNGDETEHVEE